MQNGVIYLWSVDNDHQNAAVFFVIHSFVSTHPIIYFEQDI